MKRALLIVLLAIGIPTAAFAYGDMWAKWNASYGRQAGNILAECLQCHNVQMVFAVKPARISVNATCFYCHSKQRRETE